MTTDSWHKFKNALDSAEIKKFQVDSDTDYHLFNDPENAKIVVFDEGSETFYGIRQKVVTSSEGWGDPIVVTGVEVGDIHVIKFGATADKITKFIEAMGLDLNDEQKAAVIEINKGNYDINPETGDYILAGFKVLSDEEIARLTPQQKIDYEKKLKIYNDRQKFTKPNQVVQITY